MHSDDGCVARDALPGLPAAARNARRRRRGLLVAARARGHGPGCVDARSLLRGRGAARSLLARPALGLNLLQSVPAGPALRFGEASGDPARGVQIRPRGTHGSLGTFRDGSCSRLRRARGRSSVRRRRAGAAVDAAGRAGRRGRGDPARARRAAPGVRRPHGQPRGPPGGDRRRARGAGNHHGCAAAHCGGGAAGRGGCPARHGGRPARRGRSRRPERAAGLRGRRGPLEGLQPRHRGDRRLHRRRRQDAGRRRAVARDARVGAVLPGRRRPLRAGRLLPHGRARGGGRRGGLHHASRRCRAASC